MEGGGDGGMAGPLEDSGRRIMVVDGQAERRARIVAYFLGRGYRVFAVDNAVEAIAHVFRQGTDAVILTGLLPGLSGYEAIPILKRISPELRVVLTVSDDPGVEACESRRTDFVRCFQEPVSLEEVERAIREAAPAGAA